MKLFACFLAMFLAAALPAQTLTSVEEVYKIFQNKCVSCHKPGGSAAILDLQGTGATNLAKAQSVANKLVNKNPTNAYANSQGNKLVYPGRPDRSFLFRKINGNLESTIAALHANEGSAMPSYPQPNGDLTSKEKEIIRQWIFYGAKSLGVNFDRALVENWYDNNGIKSFPDGAPAAPAAGEGFQIKMGPFYLPPSGEVEYYQKYELTNNELEVNRLDMKFSGSSHHFIVYNFTTTAASNAIPVGFRTAANHNSIKLVAAVQGPTDLHLPQTTAFKWAKNIVLDLNSHYINYSLDRPLQCEVYFNVYTQTPGTALQEMHAELYANINIPIPANGNTITHSQPEYQFFADSIYIWGLMGHTHKYGTGYKVWKRLANGQKGEIIYDASCPQGVPSNCPSPYFDYRHIPMRYFEPKSLPIKWGNGIIHEATWQNYGSQAVNFGATSDDEMQVLIAFYTEKQVVTDTEDLTILDEKQVVQVFPNPANESLKFSFSENQKSGLLQIFDAAGRLVSENSVNGGAFDLDVNRWEPGVYFWKMGGLTGRFSKI